MCILRSYFSVQRMLSSHSLLFLRFPSSLPLLCTLLISTGTVLNSMCIESAEVALVWSKWQCFAFMLCFLVSEENRSRLDSTSAMLFSTSPEVCCFSYPGPAASSWITTGIDAFLLLFFLFHSEGPILSPKSSSNLTAVNSSPLHLHFGAINHAVFIVTSFSFSGHC